MTLASTPPKLASPAPLAGARYGLLAMSLLLVHAGLLAHSACLHSFAWDEVGHLGAGLAHWQTGSFDLYCVNPPLTRLVATCPLSASGVTVEIPQGVLHPWDRVEFDVGANLIARAGPRSLWYLQVARWTCIPFSLAGGVICLLWATELFGQYSGLAALMLWCFSPNILAHGSLMTPDVAATSAGLAATYLAWKWTGTPQLSTMVACSIAVAAAFLAKFTAVLLLPVWLFGGLVQFCRSRQSHLGQIFAGAALALSLIGAGFGYERCFEPLGSIPFVSTSFTGFSDTDPRPYGNRFEGSLLGALPIPLPANYLRGIDLQRRDFELGYWSYLRGEWSSTGWWYYYLYGFAVKTPLALLPLMALAIPRLWGLPAVSLVFLLVPITLLVGVVSSNTGFNHHLRYILPAFPFVFILASAALRPLRVATAWQFAVGLLPVGLLSWFVISSLAVHPHSLSYFNESIGGPKNGPRHLLFSNVDWGQDLLLLRDWIAAKPDDDPVCVIFSGPYPSQDLGIWTATTRHCASLDACAQAMNDDGLHGKYWVAVNVGAYYDRVPPGSPDPFLDLRGRSPDVRVGYSMYVFALRTNPG